MIDILTKQLHLFFLLYAGFIGFERYEFFVEDQLEAERILAIGKRKYTKANADLKEVKQFKSNLEKSKERVRAVVENIERIQKQLPSEIIDADVNGKLVDFAKSLKILEPTPEPKAEVDKKFYYTRDYEFSGQGTFLQFLIFYEKLENLSKKGRILNVKYVHLKSSKTSDPRSRFKILDFKTTLEAYRYNNSFDLREL